MEIWNPWHGCKKISPGCENCYVYRRDEQFGKDSRQVAKTASFDLPIRKNKKGEYKLQKKKETIYTCMTSDFFLPEADRWRAEAWQMIRQRNDLHFTIITKRIHRFFQALPEDWGEGYENITIICTCENQVQAEKRLPIFLELPIAHMEIIEEPMLEEIHIEPYLATGKIERVTCGGESGENARICDYQWVLETRRQCMAAQVAFHFKQTGARFRKGEKVYRIDRSQQISQAKKAGIDYQPHIKPDAKLWERLKASQFRSRFWLGDQQRKYIEKQGMEAMRRHAQDFVRQRLAPANPCNDGKQTPMRGHPVFLAQHATGTCCRNCLAKWHGIPKGRALSQEEQEYVVSLVLEWIARQLKE